MCVKPRFVVILLIADSSASPHQEFQNTFISSAPPVGERRSGPAILWIEGLYPLVLPDRSRGEFSNNTAHNIVCIGLSP